MSALMLAAVLASLGVRDWRCYALAALSAPLVEEFQTANLSALLGAGRGHAVALSRSPSRRYRPARSREALRLADDRVPPRHAPVPGCGVVDRARRRRIVLPWAAVGFAGARGYPHLLRSLDVVERGQVYSAAQ